MTKQFVLGLAHTVPRKRKKETASTEMTDPPTTVCFDLSVLKPVQLMHYIHGKGQAKQQTR